MNHVAHTGSCMVPSDRLVLGRGGPGGSSHSPVDWITLARREGQPKEGVSLGM